MNGAGKGDDYRPVVKSKWDESYERIFGYPKTTVSSMTDAPTSGIEPIYMEKKLRELTKCS